MPARRAPGQRADKLGRVGVSRRRALQLGLAGLALSALPAAGQPAPRVSRRPRYLVLILLRGGMDAVLTTDPRRERDVDRGIDVPYPEQSILTQGGLRVGPHLHALARVAPDLTILNGVRVGTANHETGMMQLARLRTGVVASMPGIADLVGERRDGQPLGCVNLGTVHPEEHSPRHFAGDQLRAAQEMAPEDRRVLARALTRQADRMGRPDSLDARQVESQRNLRAVAVFLERCNQVPSFAAQRPAPAGLARDLQSALWLCQHDLTRCVTVSVLLPWDSHNANLVHQGEASVPFFAELVRFLGALATARGAHGPVRELTRIVLASEIGRFPRLNGDGGKDHFPEVPVMFLGGGTPAQAFGHTGRALESGPIALATGRPAAPTDRGHLVTLDDVGATVLQAFGVIPERRGYTGRVLDFLELS
jgi:hypothetical protein